MDMSGRRVVVHEPVMPEVSETVDIEQLAIQLQFLVEELFPFDTQGVQIHAVCTNPKHNAVSHTSSFLTERQQRTSQTMTSTSRTVVM